MLTHKTNPTDLTAETILAELGLDGEPAVPATPLSATPRKSVAFRSPPPSALHKPVYILDPSTYIWPRLEEVEAEEGSDAEALALLGSVFRDLAGSLKDYSTYRKQWLSAQVALNYQCQLAPLYRRPALRPVRIPTTRDEALYSIDRQVIDLHWLHWTGYQLPIGQTEFANLLTAAQFDWQLAGDFGLSHVKTDKKVTQWLALDEITAWELASLQSDATRKRLSDLRLREPAIRQRLAAVHGRRPNAADLIQIDVAHWWVNSTVGDHTATSRARAFALYLGLQSCPTPAVFARQATAAKKRLAAGMSTVRAAA